MSIVGLFTLRQKRIRGAGTFAEGNSGPLKQHLLVARTHHCLRSRMARRNTIQCSLPNTYGVHCIGRCEAVRQGAVQGRSEEGREEDGREGGSKGVGGRKQGEGVRKQ